MTGYVAYDESLVTSMMTGTTNSVPVLFYISGLSSGKANMFVLILFLFLLLLLL